MIQGIKRKTLSRVTEQALAIQLAFASKEEAAAIAQQLTGIEAPAPAAKKPEELQPSDDFFKSLQRMIGG